VNVLRFKKMIFGVSFSFIFLSGFIFIILFNSPTQTPVIRDVNAQMNYSSNAMMGSYVTNGSYSSSNLGSFTFSFGSMGVQGYGSRPYPIMTTSESCGYKACGLPDITLGEIASFSICAGQSLGVCGNIGGRPLSDYKIYEYKEVKSKPYSPIGQPIGSLFGGGTGTTCSYGIGCSVTNQVYYPDYTVTRFTAIFGNFGFNAPVPSSLDFTGNRCYGQPIPTSVCYSTGFPKQSYSVTPSAPPAY
jgi:hypothetical protein